MNSIKHSCAIPVSVAVVAASIITGCADTAARRAQVAQNQDDRISVGTVQREIRTGMTGADVVQILGSPNIVTSDEQRREVWIYDKISTESAYSRGGAYGTILILGASSEGGASSSSQKTLTIIVKFDDQGLVRDFAYRQSSF